MRILIVEDDPMVRDINQKFAQRIEEISEIEAASNLESAKAFLLKKKFDLVLLDVYFPEGKGTDLLKWIRDEKIECEIVFITADKSVETVEHAFRYGTVDYLIKPFTYERFEEAIRMSLRRIQAIPEAGTLEQSQLDKLFRRDHQPKQTVAPMEKGLSRKTYELIWREIEKMDHPCTPEEIGTSSGLARVTVRRYLEYMVREGVLKMDLSYGKVGRPQHLYQKVIR
jgi:two-component system CitB family response regulator